MKKEIIQTGKTVDAAIEQACAELGLPRDEVEFEIIDLPKKGFLGLKSYPAKVRVFSIKDEEPAPAPALKAARQEKPAPAKTFVREHQKPAPVQEKEAASPAVSSGNTAAKEETAVAYIKTVLSAMGAEKFQVQANKQENTLNITLTGEDLGFVIGRRGETIDAIQYLTGLAINRMEGDYLRITIDSGNFREKREKTLESLAKRLARNTVRTGRSVTLEPMNPYERRIIHATVATVEGATSSSIGEEPNRRVVISSLTPRKQSSGGYRGQRKPYNRDGKGGRDNRRGDKPYRKNSRGPRKDYHAAEEAQEQAPVVTDVLPKDAESKPLYSKIEL